MGYPQVRLRRLRRNAKMRSMVWQVQLRREDLIYPMFVRPGAGIKQPIESLVGCYYFSPDAIVEEVKCVADLGISAVLLFGTDAPKDAEGSEAWSSNSIVCQAIEEIKKANVDILVATDVCLCPYTEHGHCGVIEDGKVANDRTCGNLAKMAVAHANAGADIIAPSDMMDGRVGVIRGELDGNGFEDIAILSYSAKYASAFYGPFRDAAGSAPKQGDRKSYQMDPANVDIAVREVQLDIEEGADIVMVKPAMPYLDIITRIKQRFDVPVAAYHVSGEYMAVCAAAAAGYIDLEAGMMESLLSIKRAGADIILTYFAKEAAELI